jgi:hypothetical protein
VVKGRLGQEQQVLAAEAGDLTGYFTGCRNQLYDDQSVA